MKKIVGILLASLLLFAAALAAEPVDLSALTDAELLALVEQAGAELRARNTPAGPDDPLADLHYASNGREVRINAYTGNGGDVYIPDEIGGVPVTRLYDRAFLNTVITSLRLPAGLVSIGEHGVQGTYHLEDVLVLPRTLQLLDRCAFRFSDIAGVVLQSDCQLRYWTFADCDRLQFCYIRKGYAVTLGEKAFMNARALETVVIPADVTRIDATAFSGCNFLTVYCPAGSYAEKYCLENFIVCDTANYEAMVAYYEALYPAG